ncbi:type IV pili twitching motility protein PilT [Candidatus Desantisbacteria bacterium CG_4_8_14_3_um_filter_40_12]|uniref:Type IV pili twitching motility protein PilT n=1 Tax=Candidatus Desantisbacteria bacterium CG_4_8_14_3_um_filter_40_12 TaxID=1974545 RepID=A0A2M7JCY9_9BACT|nr:MAG: type IV pili twitching motility protein PilT [Candidatus Desantisbacteria bacterium CG_4_8_14_3_um_filter_40_12]
MVRTDFDKFLEIAVKCKASDLHLKAESPPLLRIQGEIMPLKQMSPLSAEQVRKMAMSIMDENQRKRFAEDMGVDVGYDIPGLARFRTHVFQQREMIGIVTRIIPFNILTIEELGIPPICMELCSRPRGLIMITGSSGCGKSTTQAALIDYINKKFPHHIMTIEDPIEFVHTCKESLVNQRELGRDTYFFSEALKHVFREDPDVILIGEMRDLETISLAVTAAETGHLVLGTLHTTDTISTIDRIVDVFPPHQQQQVRMQLTINLVGIISQLLVKKADGSGRIAAFETLIATPAVRSLIREAKTYQIASVLQTGKKQGMMSMDQSLSQLVHQRIVTYDDALNVAINPRDFKQLVGNLGMKH